MEEYKEELNDKSENIKTLEETLAKICGILPDNITNDNDLEVKFDKNSINGESFN